MASETEFDEKRVLKALRKKRLELDAIERQLLQASAEVAELKATQKKLLAEISRIIKDEAEPGSNLFNQDKDKEKKAEKAAPKPAVKVNGDWKAVPLKDVLTEQEKDAKLAAEIGLETVGQWCQMDDEKKAQAGNKLGTAGFKRSDAQVQKFLQANAAKPGEK